MSRKLICISAYLLSAFMCLSQKTDWKFGINVTPAIAWTTASGDIEPGGSRFSFDLSVQAEKYFSERYAFYSGISFFRMAGQFKNNSISEISFKSGNAVLGIEEKATYAIQYLTIPVGLKLKTPQYGPFLYYFQGGLLPGIKVGGSIATKDEKHSLAKDVNLMTCAVQLSLGILYPTGDDTYIKTGVIFNRFFVDALSASNMKILPTSLGLQIGFIF